MSITAEAAQKLVEFGYLNPLQLFSLDLHEEDRKTVAILTRTFSSNMKAHLQVCLGQDRTIKAFSDYYAKIGGDYQKDSLLTIIARIKCNMPSLECIQQCTKSINIYGYLKETTNELNPDELKDTKYLMKFYQWLEALPKDVKEKIISLQIPASGIQTLPSFKQLSSLKRLRLNYPEVNLQHPDFSENDKLEFVQGYDNRLPRNSWVIYSNFK